MFSASNSLMLGTELAFSGVRIVAHTYSYFVIAAMSTTMFRRQYHLLRVAPELPRRCFIDATTTFDVWRTRDAEREREGNY